jgi:hypothetical protein
MSPNGIEHCKDFQITLGSPQGGGGCPTMGEGDLVESFRPLPFTQHLSIE